MAKYNVYPGKFICQKCEEEVKTVRSYPDLKEVTWMCSKKHLSKVSFARKSKKDYQKDE
jgi:hypothetical protein